MEKQGVIKPGVTPPEHARPAGEKAAAAAPVALDELEDDATKRLAETVANQKKPVTGN